MDDEFRNEAAKIAAQAVWADHWVRRDPAVDPEQLLAHPANARIHPSRQQRALEAVLDRLGLLDDVKVNINTGRVFNGHMRCLVAMKRGATIPVAYYDLTEQQEVEALAVFDALAGMVIIDQDLYADLVADFPDPTPEIRNIFDSVTPTKPAPASSNDQEPEPDTPEALIYGMVGWSETKVKATSDEIADLTRLHNQYRAENGGSDEGFVEWFTRSLLD